MRRKRRVKKWGTESFLSTHGPIYHNNGALYANTGKHTRGYIHDSIPLYHKNGKLYARTYNHELSKDVLVTEKYDSTGVMIENWYIENKYSEPTWISKNGVEYEVVNYMEGSRFIAPSANFPIKKQLKESYNGVYNNYYGTITGGIYSIGDRYELTGIFASTLLENGNGSVVFIEDLLEKKYYWAIIVDSKIIKTFPAQKSEKPTLDDILLTEKDYFSIMQQKKSLKEFKLKKTHTIINDIDYKAPYSVAIINSPNIQNYTGYGVKTETKDISVPAQYRKVQVGIFKNGKLNGVGFECSYNRSLRNNDFTKDNLIFRGTVVEVKYGIFKDGVFSEGFENKGDLIYNEVIDFWKDTGYENVKYANISTKIYNVVGNDKPEFYFKNNEPLSLSSISTNDQIYIFSLNRLFKIHKVDSNKKEIILKSDVEGKYFVINGDGITTSNFAKAKFLVVKYEKENTTKYCRTTIKVPIIDKVARKVTSTQRSYIGSHSYSKGGLTYTYPKQPDVTSSSTIYEDKLVGYRDEICPQCKGTGIMPFIKDVKNGYLFDFDPANISKKEQTENNSTKTQSTKKQVTTETNTTQSFYVKKIIAIPQGTNQHNETKAVLLEKENYMISKGLSFDEKNTEYVKLFDELYAIDKYRAYRLIMAIDIQYVRTTMDKFTAEQKLFLREYSREQVKGVQLKK